MSSRRLMNRSLSSDGRSYYSANDIAAPNRRSGGRSYLSSVRSESRSTLCSVMAQLAEEIQPTFESTLKSKAVSEDANVKFNCVVSGYPVPEVTWYKDDIQLDRYCGLPKYEISHEDKTHTLQIYNCTLEDAAIYQASAQNSRGIVSCSGVLEVGTMSEYKIHQNYFAKLKLRNENRRRELEEHRNMGKNNVPAVLEHDRMISPERAQRKRRSIETRRAGSPSEENAVEVDVLSQIPPLEDRLAPHVHVSEAASFHGISNSEMIANRDSEGPTYVHDTVQRAFSKETNEHYVKKLKIAKAATERSKENRPTGRREEMNERVTLNEKMEVQNTVVTESRNEMDITDRQKGEKQPVMVNKSESEESKRAHCAWIASVTESRTKMVITDTKMDEKQSINVNKSVSEESTRAKGVQITSVTESRNKMLQTGTKTDEKQRVKVNKSLTEESKTAQGAQIASVTESRTKMVITDTKTNEKQSVKVNKSASEESKRAQSAQITKITESRNKMVRKDTKTDEKQSVKVNKSLDKESKTAQGAQIASVTESKNKMDITDRQKREQQLGIVNKSASEEPKRAKGAQIASATESRNKMVITDTKINKNQSVNVNKSPSNESKSAQDTQITTVTESRKKMDITDTRKSEKQSENAKKSPSNESNRVQKPTATQNLLEMKVSLTTLTNEMVENKKLTKSSDKGTSNPQLQAVDTIQNCNPRFTDNKLMDFDDHKNGNPVGTCVRILSHSCGGNDVSVDTGERNASACSLRGLAADDTHTEPTEPPIHEDIPPFHKEVVKKLKEQPPLMCEVTASVTDTLSSSYLSSQGQKLRAGDQSVASTKSTQPSEKMSSGHVSHMLCDGQVTTAMSSSLGDDTITDVCEKDIKAENQLVKESDKPQDEAKPACMPLMTNLNTITNVHVKNSISKEKSSADSNHSTNQVIVTEFVQICTLNSDVVQSQIMNSSSISKVEKKDTDAKEFRSSSLVATDNIPKIDTQEQSKVNTVEVRVPMHHKMQSDSAKKGNDHSGPSTFLSQHSKASPREFTIPTIYITDVDSTSQNSTDKTEHTVCESAINESEPVKIRNEANAVTSNVTNSNTVSQKSTPTHSDCTDFTNKTTAILESESLRSQTSEVNKPDQHPLSQEILIQGPGSSSHCSTENVTTAFTRLSEVTTQRHNADKSTKTNESDLTETSHLQKTDLKLKTDSDFFIKQLKSAALDLEMSNQAIFNTATHINSKDNGEEVSSAAILPGVCKVTIPLKNTDHQANSTTHSEMATRMNQKTTFPSSKTEKSEIGMTVSLEEANRDVYQGDKLSLKTQPESLLQLVSNSPSKTSFETHSPRLIRRSIPADLPKPAGNENIKPKSTEKDKENQFKVPQVIRKIRPEIFDASGHLKLWCQFFNIVSDSTIRWYKDEVEIAEIKRSAGDETQVCLAIIRMSKRDCGVYRCTITNDYGKDSTEYLLSAEFLSNMFLCEELQEVGEEIEMTPLIFSKGLADAGCWGSKFYGRVTTEEPQVGMGCEHKTRRLKVIYGLDPVFESGSSCFMKVRSPIVYESREETVLAERNLQITKQECRIQNMAREYFKIFAAETRVIESFGAALEVIPLYFMYCPASSIPYATVEAELKGVYMRYCSLDRTGSLVLNEKIEVGQKCSSLQHWIHQWTNGNVLFSRLEGVDTILTNVGIAIRSKGYQGFPCEAHPKVFEQFHIQHQCNYFCGLLNLKPLKAPEILQTPTRSKGSSSPLIQRRTASSSSSPQTSRKATKSPTVSRKINPQTST